MRKIKNPGFSKNTPLAIRMKEYESVTTGLSLVRRLPIYARIDMRAGHTWCRGLDKPFDIDYSNAMKAATSYVTDETGAALGFCQSDEASFVWPDDTKVPFGTRLFKLQSVLASMFTGAFIKACLGTKLEQKVWRRAPSFDCRVANMPDLSECANMILWRSRDSVKNSITLLALEHFSNKEIHKKSGEEKIRMLAEKGIDYNTAVAEDLREGAFFRRETYERELTAEEVAKIPEKARPAAGTAVTRSRTTQFSLGMPVGECANKVEALFFGAKPVDRDKADGVAV